MSLKSTCLKNAFVWHKLLGWVGGAALVMFALSALAHLLLTWTGPNAVAFFPPQAVIEPAQVSAIPHILKRHGIDQASMVKIVPVSFGAALQVTQGSGQPRRYFDLKSFDEIPDFEWEQAEWLARYYTGLSNVSVTSITQQTAFDDAYPWVNRLLPVYRVTFNTPDQRTAFVYTELGQLASLTNTYKTRVQSVFRTLHTWHWLNEFEHARVLLMGIMLLALLGMVVLGCMMLFMIKKRVIRESGRRWHRYVGYAVWLPLLMVTVSGSYHLLQYAYVDSERGLDASLIQPLPVNDFGQDFAWVSEYQDTLLNGVSLVVSQGQWLYRFSMPAKRAHTKVDREARYRGQPIEQPALYHRIEDGVLVDKAEPQYAIEIAKRYVSFTPDQVNRVEPVTRFSSDYDFRNKRLPVWRVSLDTDAGDRLFVDTATGVLVDRLVDVEYLESLSFSFLHKWNPLRGVLGRAGRDLLILMVLLSSLFLTGLGYRMLWRRRGARKF